MTRLASVGAYSTSCVAVSETASRCDQFSPPLVERKRPPSSLAAKTSCASTGLTVSALTRPPKGTAGDDVGLTSVTAGGTTAPATPTSARKHRGTSSQVERSFEPRRLRPAATTPVIGPPSLDGGHRPAAAGPCEGTPRSIFGV